MPRTLLTVKFWADALERSIKSFAQGVLAAFGQDAVGADLFEADWKSIVASGLTLAGLSLLTSIASSGVQSGTGPASLVPPGV